MVGRASGEYVSDTGAIVRRAMVAVGLGRRADDLFALALARASLAAAPVDAMPLWDFCEAHVLPIVRDRAGESVAERLGITLEGAVLALDAIQNGRPVRRSQRPGA